MACYKDETDTSDPRAANEGMKDKDTRTSAATQKNLEMLFFSTGGGGAYKWCLCVLNRLSAGMARAKGGFH